MSKFEMAEKVIKEAKEYAERQEITEQKIHEDVYNPQMQVAELEEETMRMIRLATNRRMTEPQQESAGYPTQVPENKGATKGSTKAKGPRVHKKSSFNNNMQTELSDTEEWSEIEENAVTSRSTASSSRGKSSAQTPKEPDLQ